MPNSANLTESFAAGAISPEATVSIVDSYVRTVYSSGVGVDVVPYACDANGLATLTHCPKGGGKPRSLLPGGETVRSVTLAGAFDGNTFVTGGRKLSMKEVEVRFCYFCDPADSLSAHWEVCDLLYIIEYLSRQNAHRMFAP